VWERGWRDQVWSRLDEPWDLLVIGGGITGAGILREAALAGWRALLVEAGDFASGTSSRSSKLVHGGLRYLRDGKLALTRTAVQQRELLLRDGRGLVEPLGFLVAGRTGRPLERALYRLGFNIYDLLAARRTFQRFSAADFQALAPYLDSAGLCCGFRYEDAQTDDARLVLRVLREAGRHGGVAVNYVTVKHLLTTGTGTVRVAGAAVHDRICGREAEVKARVVINATGAWADRLRRDAGGVARLRPLRGSHLMFPRRRLPVAQAVMFMNPSDRRPMFVIPWEGATLYGTTDVDHGADLDEEPAITGGEVDYLMTGLAGQFPSLDISSADVIATFAGVRPVVGTGTRAPSREPRDHVVWEERGLITVTGGKLTTYRVVAHEALQAARRRLPAAPPSNLAAPAFDRVAKDALADMRLDPLLAWRLTGRYGTEAPLVATAERRELEAISTSHALWAELRHGARSEGVVHLEDLLLRRVRLGLVLEDGGAALESEFRRVCQPELGWTDEQWESEWAAYRATWKARYRPPG
jgi:glycerol-3-phosphate dehydrogenase